MGRLSAVLVLVALICTGVAYHFDMFKPPSPTSLGNVANPSGVPAVLPLGDLLFAPEPMKPLPPPSSGQGIDPIRVWGTLAVKEKEEVPSSLEGQIAFIGEEIPQGALLIAGGGPFLSEPYRIARFKLPVGDREQSDKEVTRVYRRCEKGQRIQADQMVALINPGRAMTELLGKETKVKAAVAEYKAAVETTLVTKVAFDLSKELFRRGKAEAEFTVITSEFQWKKSQQEEIKLLEGIALAKSEVANAQLILAQHEIRSKVKNGIIKEIRKELGEAVKPGDPIMDVYSLVEGLYAEVPIEVQYYARLKSGMPLTIVPTQEESPVTVWEHHRAKVNSVAFTCDQEPLVVSGSEDWTVQVWDRQMKQARYGPFAHTAPVRVVACSPKNPDLVLSGCSDGSIHLWNIREQKDSGRQIPATETAHREAITCLAFSPDGKWFASGSADAGIKLWNVESGDLVYAFDAEHGCVSGHQGPITSLHITPQCRLVSASQDNSIRVWTLKKRGAELQNTLPGRNGSVAQLGVSDDGRFMLFDLDNSLQILSVEKGKTLSTLKNPTGNVGFQTLALFSPDASLLLTAGAAEGRLQLWSAPHGNDLGYEVRQLVTVERKTVACAAFAPGDPLNRATAWAASGTEDGLVYLWAIPSEEEVKTHPIRDLHLAPINPALNQSTRQIQLGAEVRNPKGRFLPGRPVMMIIEQQIKSGQ